MTVAQGIQHIGKDKEEFQGMHVGFDLLAVFPVNAVPVNIFVGEEGILLVQCFPHEFEVGHRIVSGIFFQ